MIKFKYGNAKNISIIYKFFELDYQYYYYFIFENNIKLCIKLQLANYLAKKLQKLIIIYQ